MSHFSPAIVVFERSRRREIQLKRRLAGDRVLVRPCRSAGDLLDLCRARPGSVAVIARDVGAGPALRCREDGLTQRLVLASLVIASAEFADLEWPLRELGATAVLPETVRAEKLVRLCRRLLTDHRSTCGWSPGPD